MEKIMERFADYFLRYTADVPADEVGRHMTYDRHCRCQPSVTFDDLSGWHSIVHQSLEGE